MPVQWWTELRSVFSAALIVLLTAGFAAVPDSGDPATTADDPVRNIAEGWPGTLKEVSEPRSCEGQVEYRGDDLSGRPTVDDLARASVGGAGEEKREHRVQSGETLSCLAAQFDISIHTLAAANDLRDPDVVRAGRTLIIPPEDGLHHRVRRGETLWTIARQYQVSVQEIESANDLTSDLIQPEQVLFVPTPLICSPAAALTADAQGGSGHPQFRWPLTIRGRISSPYGPRWGGFHYGLDIAVPEGTRILAAAQGRVVAADWKGSYGLTVRLDHGNGYETVYAHASQLEVNDGEVVQAGHPIARVGTTGRSTGPHLHFEVRVGGEPRDPQNYLQ